jgi:hypothetical protein
VDYDRGDPAVQVHVHEIVGRSDRVSQVVGNLHRTQIEDTQGRAPGVVERFGGRATQLTHPAGARIGEGLLCTGNPLIDRKSTDTNCRVDHVNRKRTMRHSAWLVLLLLVGCESGSLEEHEARAARHLAELERRGAPVLVVSDARAQLEAIRKRMARQ